MVIVINIGNRTEWSPIRSVIIRVTKTMTKFEKETRHRLYVFVKKKHQFTRRNARQ